MSRSARKAPVGTCPSPCFAPTDEAFGKIPKADLDALLKDKAKLTRVLTYHVVPGRVMAKDVAMLKEAKTVEGDMVRIDTSSGVNVNGASVVKADVEASNGVIRAGRRLGPPGSRARDPARPSRATPSDSSNIN